MMGGLIAVAACFPDPPNDDGLLDSGIFLSDGSPFEADIDSATSGLSLSSLTVDFGLSECGGLAPKNQTLTLTNTSADAITYGLAVSGDQFFLASAASDDSGTASPFTASGSIPPGQSVDIGLAASAVSPFATAAGLIEGALQVVTNAPGQKLFVVDLKETAAGAQLTMIPNMASSVADFGLVSNGEVGQIDVSFRNNGNEPISVAFDDQPFPPFALENDDDAGEGFTIAANSTKTLKATFSPVTEEENSQNLSFHTTGVTCGGGDTPSSIRLQGEQGYSGVSIIPGTLTFDVGGTGFVPCGKVGTPQKVTVTNPVDTDYPDLAIVNLNVTGPFTVSPGPDQLDAGGGMIPIAAGTNLALTVTPLTVTAPQNTQTDGVSGMLEIDLSNEDSIIVQLSQTAQGAVLSFTQPSMEFGNAPLDVPTMQLLGITNSGNAAVGLTIAVTGSPYFSVSPSQTYSVNTPGGSATVTFLPIAAGPAQGSLTFSPTGAVCSLPPQAVIVSANGSADAGLPDSGFDAGSIVLEAGPPP